MSHRRMVTEMGMGVDVHGGDHTKAAKRAVSDAIRHSSLNFFRALDRHPDDMQITLLLGSPDPEAIDLDSVAAELPYGSVTASAVQGGLEIPAGDGADAVVIVNAAVIVHLDLNN